MHNLILLLDLLFPPRATRLAVRGYTDGDIKHTFHCVDGIWYATGYSSTLMQALIIENKFYATKKATAALSYFLEQFLIEKKLQAAYVVPIPLSKKRQRNRGYNQVTNILKATSVPIQIRTDLIQRTKDTPPQVGLERMQRLQNVTGAFSGTIKACAQIPDNQSILLVDDVFTTGTTLKEARATLAPLVPPSTRIICFAIAH